MVYGVSKYAGEEFGIRLQAVLCSVTDCYTCIRRIYSELKNRSSGHLETRGGFIFCRFISASTIFH